MIVRTFISAIMTLILAGCSSVPITGRSQLNIIPASTMLSMSAQEYGTFMKENKPSANREQTQMVKRVGTRIQGAVERYFRDRGLSARLSDYRWEFNLVEDKQVNAWCMPGGKVVVYTGILPVARDEDGLAVVMGHEIAHAIAEHGNERMSQGLLTQLGGVALSEALAAKPAATKELWMTAYGAGAQFGAVLPYSRLQENEADHLGLVFMAMAGYDVNQATAFWQRMSAQKGGKSQPEFFSTHPADATRIEKIRKLVPEVKRQYAK